MDAGQQWALTRPDAEQLAALDARHGGRWFIWRNRAGWHARRKGASLTPGEAGLPLPLIQADSAAALAAQLAGEAGSLPAQARPPGVRIHASTPTGRRAS